MPGNLDIGPLQTGTLDIGPIQSGGSPTQDIQGEADGVGNAQCTLGASSTILLLPLDMNGGFTDLTGGFDA